MKVKLRIAVIAAAVLVVVLLVAWFWFQNRPMEKLPTVEPPTGAQLLLFPMKDGLITAGYRNPTYLEKNNFTHYGTDLTSADGGKAEILASGSGIVLGTEFCDNSLGHIVVIRYDNVFLPQTGEIISLIARYYHMTGLEVSKGDVLHTGQVIGAINDKHRWYNHIHIEFDTDLEYPFNTPQVAEATSALLNRYPASGEGMPDPISVLAVGKDQRIFVHPLSDCCTEKDNPQFAQK